MTFRLSILDKSPTGEDGNATRALQTSLSLARLADQLGYHRIWFAEHHGVPALAGSAPEVLIAHVLAITSRIRVGSGGVLLQHYSPYKVAETFGVLANLAPGRVDLGIGRAPGGMPAGRRALQWELAAEKRPFEQKLRELDHFIRGTLPLGHPLEGAQALPAAAALPQLFLLGASAESARLAGKLGWNYGYSGHHNGDASLLNEVKSTHARAGGRAFSVAVSVVIAGSASEAARLTQEARVFKVTLPDGHSVNLPSEDAAREYARQSGENNYTLQPLTPQLIAGTPAQVLDRLDELHRTQGIDEFVLDLPTTGARARFEALEALANHRHLTAA
jgi:luciferase family oxidoreductase group 1